MCLVVAVLARLCVVGVCSTEAPEASLSLYTEDPHVETSPEQLKTVCFGYELRDRDQFVAEVDAGSSWFTPNPKDRGQNTLFLRGKHACVFTVTLQVPESCTWRVKGPNGNIESVTAVATAPMSSMPETPPLATFTTPDLPTLPPQESTGVPATPTAPPRHAVDHYFSP